MEICSAYILKINSNCEKQIILLMRGIRGKEPLKKEENPSQRNCQNQLSHPSLSHIEQECQESLIQGKIHIQQNSNEGLEYL